MFEDVIRTLQQERDRYFLPEELPEREQIEVAIRLLEAAGRLTAEDKTWLEHRVEQAIAEYNPIIDGITCPGRARKDRFRAILDALPDKEK